jgi:hypothetical protein
MGAEGVIILTSCRLAPADVASSGKCRAGKARCLPVAGPCHTDIRVVAHEGTGAKLRWGEGCGAAEALEARPNGVVRD